MNLERALDALEDEAAEYGRDTPLGALMYQCAEVIREHADHEWLPIETAEKGDRVIRLWGSEEVLGYWGTYQSQWVSRFTGRAIWPQPTHWRPTAKGPA